MVSTVVPQKAETTNKVDKISVFSVPRDINGIKGSQGPRIKKMKRAHGVHWEIDDLCDSTFSES